jgi:RimJ/RimL family protein N-acetyltransferase
MGILVLRKERVLLRGWEPRDAEPFAALNADPVAMEFFPSTLSRAESDAMIGRMQKNLEERGWGFWSLEIDGTCAGFVGLSVPTFEAHFTPCVEIGWRLAPAVWGRGYATEAARLAVDLGFGRLGLTEILSFTAVRNVRSRRVMERLRMVHDSAGDFDHPRLPIGHSLRRHVLYRLQNPRAASNKVP